jgi:hypothetical protein
LIVACAAFTGCTNNLVNEWEDYTGDTDVYYSSTPETDAPVSPSPETSAPESAEKEELAQYGIPEYWQNELDSAVESTHQAIDNSNEDYTAFLWYSDAHWSYSAQRSVDILKYLQDKTDVQIVNFGGDIVSNNKEVEHSVIVSELNEWRKDTLKLSGHHSVVGNHDDDLDEFASRDDLYDFLLGDESDKTTDAGNKFCYYVDNDAENTRYIYLSTGFDETSSSDISFLINILSSTQEDWHIVLVSHIWFSYYDTATPTEGTVPDFAKVILDVADAYNARTSGTTSGIYYDFTSAAARVEFCIGGHTHVDFEFYTDGGLPVVLNETDSFHLRGGNKSLDKTDEASVNVIVVDYSNQIINIIRAGRGGSRTVSLSNTK